MLGFDALSKRSRVARRLVLNAAAKINLALEVLGKRDDGYHEVATVMQAVDLSDRLVIEDAEGLELRVSAPNLPSDGRNLVVRAAHALREATAVSRGARITLDKRIPVAAGLGGGSADAAAALVGLSRLWGLRWPLQRARACRGHGLQAGGEDRSRGPGGGSAGRSDVGQRAPRVRRRALVRPRAADPGARRPGLLGVLGGARDSRPGDPDDPGPLRRRERWGVAKWQGAGLWIPYSEVRILPPQPHIERGTDGLRTECLCVDRKVQPRVPISARLVADLLEAAGIDRVLALDLHAGQIQGFFRIPVDHLFAAPVIIDYLGKKELREPVIVAPDAGGVERARAIAKRLNASLAIIDKRREGPNSAVAMHLIGDVQGRGAVVIDDMIDTASTLIQAVSALEREGARRILACGVHPVLSGPAVERITKSPLEEVIVTNSILLPAEKRTARVAVLTVAPLLGEAIRRIHDEESVSTLFV